MNYFWGIAIIAGFIWFFANANGRGEKASTKTGREKTKITEEEVFEKQNSFEKNFENTHAPTALRGKDIYIYSRLMLPWFNQLSSENRYDDDMIQKLRSDWLTYFNSLEQSYLDLFLSMEAEDDEVHESHYDDHVAAMRQVYAIEDAFAASVGSHAMKELKRIREIDSMGSFSGRGELAPEGFIYDPKDNLMPAKQQKR